jgi:DNA polymerase-1
LIDILGLWGDASDNIPGVPGIGEKTAIKLIGEFGSVEKLLENTDKLKGKQKENVENFSEQAILSKRLATIDLDVPIDFNENDLERIDPDIRYLKELFDELEFRNFAKRLFTDLSLEETSQPVQGSLFDTEGDEGSSVPLKNIYNTDHIYHLVDTIDKANELVVKFLKEKMICFDTETTGLDPNNSELVGISFAVKPHEAWYIPISKNYHEAQKFVQILKPLFESNNIIKIGQNIKFDINILSWYDVQVAGPFFDTMIAHYLLQPDMRHNMDILSETYLNYEPVSIEKLIGQKGKNQLNMREVDIELVKEYASEDADVTLQLKNVFEPKLEETGTSNLFDKTEMPLVPVLASMESEGIKLDVPALNEFSIQLKNEIIKIEAKIYELADTEFNIASPKQLGEVLFEKLAITSKPKKTKTGQYKTGEDILIKLIYKHPIVEEILEYRSLAKLKSTYVDALPALVNPRDGRIHTSLNQAVAATGRLSSNTPNLQNIPIRSEKGREIRKAFIPRNDNFVLLAADYSQIELRIIAHLSKDKALIEAFNEGRDIHTATAARVYGVEYHEVTTYMRRHAETGNYGIV